MDWVLSLAERTRELDTFDQEILGRRNLEKFSLGPRISLVFQTINVSDWGTVTIDLMASRLKTFVQ